MAIPFSMNKKQKKEWSSKRVGLKVTRRWEKYKYKFKKFELKS